MAFAMLEEVCRSLGSPPPMFFFVGGSPCKLKAKTLSGSVLWHVPPHSHNHNNKRRKERKKFLVPTLPRIGVQFSVSFYLSAKKNWSKIFSLKDAYGPNFTLGSNPIRTYLGVGPIELNSVGLTFE